MLKLFILKPSNLIVFYNEINLFLFSSNLHYFKVKMIKNQIYLNNKNVIFSKNKILDIKNKQITSNLVLNLLLFYCQINFLGKCIRFRINGRGYRLFSELNHILFKLGYSHVINFTLPMEYEMQKKEKNQSFFKVSGTGFVNINSMLYKIKSLRQPNLYSKKGIFIKNQIIFFKEGKKNFTL